MKRQQIWWPCARTEKGGDYREKKELNWDSSNLTTRCASCYNSAHINTNNQAPSMKVQSALCHEGALGSGCVHPHFLDEGEWSASRAGRFTFATHWIWGWVGPRTGLDDLEDRKFVTLPGLKLQLLRSPAHSQSLYRLIIKHTHIFWIYLLSDITYILFIGNF
jgi:hypothetical protein